MHPPDLTLNPFVVGVWLTPAIVAFIALIATRRSDRTTRDTVLNLTRILVIGYIGAAVFLTLWPFHPTASVARLEHGNWAPFHGMLGFLISTNDLQNKLGARDVFANMLLFFPIGLLLPSALMRWHPFVATFVVLVVFAFGLEITQGLAIVQRTFDIDDAISGLAGGLGGLILSAVMNPLVGRR